MPDGRCDGTWKRTIPFFFFFIFIFFFFFFLLFCFFRCLLSFAFISFLTAPLRNSFHEQLLLLSSAVHLPPQIPRVSSRGTTTPFFKHHLSCSSFKYCFAECGTGVLGFYRRPGPFFFPSFPAIDRPDSADAVDFKTRLIPTTFYI